MSHLPSFKKVKVQESDSHSKLETEIGKSDSEDSVNNSDFNNEMDVDMDNLDDEIDNIDDADLETYDDGIVGDFDEDFENVSTIKKRKRRQAIRRKSKIKLRPKAFLDFIHILTAEAKVKTKKIRPSKPVVKDFLETWIKPERVPFEFIDDMPQLIEEGYESDASLDFSAINLDNLDEEDKLYLSMNCEDERSRRQISRIKKQSDIEAFIKSCGCDLTFSNIDCNNNEVTPNPNRVSRTLDYNQVKNIKQLNTLKPQLNQIKSKSETEFPQTSSRTKRSHHRLLSFGMEKTSCQASDALKFSQLQTRKKVLRFEKSRIHDWGLFSGEHIENQGKFKKISR
jgi:hypothetical protein